MLLLLLFIIKHFLADYYWQTLPMVMGKRQRVNWLGWLMTHAGVHGMLTSLILIPFTSVWSALALGAADCVAHAVIDRIKAHPDLGGRFDRDSRMFWICMGLDQMAHMLTYLVIIAYVLETI
jgi:hypothetical protein